MEVLLVSGNLVQFLIDTIKIKLFRWYSEVYRYENLNYTTDLELY